MALQVWLPLNGNLKNQGVANVTVTNNGGDPSYADGKIGQGLSTTGGKYWTISGITLGSEASIACWTKTSTQSKMPWVLGADVYASLNLYESTIYTLNIGDSNNNPFQNNGSNVSVLVDNVWHHFVVTFGNNQAKLYIDGAYAGTAKTFRSPACTNSNIRLAGGFMDAHTYDWNGMLNDFRVYDHCLSPKEVKEISKGLIGHYKLNTVENAPYDSSGYGNNGTIGKTLYNDVDTPRYGNSTVFSGNSFVALGRNLMVKDAVTVSCWGNMQNWSSYTNGLVSCTENGGWGLWASNGQLVLDMGTGVSSNSYKEVTGSTSLSALSSGWHHFAWTYDGFNVKLYVDGELDGTNAAYITKTPIFYNAGNGVFIGGEPGSSQVTPKTYFTGKISDVRVYATALSDDDIKELYNASAYITNNGTLGGYEFIEDETSPEVAKSGIIKSNNFSEYSSNSKVLSDGSVWIRLLHHNQPSTYLFTQSNCWNNNDANLFSALGLLKNDTWANSSGEYEFMICEKTTSGATEGVYRWKQTSNPATTSTVTGYSVISGSPAHPLSLRNNGSYGCFHNGSTWWVCCGSWQRESGGVPGVAGYVTTGYIDFYVRVPELKMLDESNAIFHENNIQNNQLIEI